MRMPCSPSAPCTRRKRRITYPLSLIHISGIGAEIKPENQITLIARKDTSYTNASFAIEAPKVPCKNVVTYQDDSVSHAEVENEPVRDVYKRQVCTLTPFNSGA